MILLPCPKRPDLDCIAGAVGYAEYLCRAKNLIAKAWLCGIPDGEAQFYLDLFPEIDFAKPDEVQSAQGFILVDFSTIGFLSPGMIAPEKVIEVIDHRFFTAPEKEFPQARIQIDPVGAAATQITEYFMRDNILPPEATSALLYGAIYSHTLLLNGETCTDRDRAAVQWLKEKDDNADQHVAAQLQARRQQIIAEFPAILSTEMKMEKNRHGIYGISQLEMIAGEAFWHEYKSRIIDYFKRYDHPVFLNLIDLSSNTSLFYATPPMDADIFSSHVEEIHGEADIIRLIPALMRKQIIPLINNM